MTSRNLPESEWSKVDASSLLRYANPEDVRIAVVENKDKIVGKCVVLKITHLEGLWIDQKHRNAGIMNALMKQIVKASRELTNEFVMAGAGDGDDRMLSLLIRLGAERLPQSFFALGIGA